MSNEDAVNMDERSATVDTRARIEALETHLPRNRPVANEHLSTVRGHVTAYERADSDADEENALDEIEAELEQLRTTVEEELEEGKEKAHDLIDDVEDAVSNLRQ
jgi:uncharacterized protein (UPF0216 family)